MPKIQIADLSMDGFIEPIRNACRKYADLESAMAGIQRKTARSKPACRKNHIPIGIARDLKEAICFPSFSEYMERTLYDPAFGYYGTGKVAFGSKNHFFTYPGEMSPVFGWMMAEAILYLFKVLFQKKSIPSNAPLTILELGGGEGILAKDVMDYIHNRAGISAWKAIAGKIHYVIIEKSPSLRERQEKYLWEYIQSDRITIIEADGVHVEWEGSFYGVVIANEFIDALPCERIRIFDSRPNCSRVHVVPYLNCKPRDFTPCSFPSDFHFLADKGHVPMDSNALWRYLADAHFSRKGNNTLKKLTFGELEAPLSLGWADDRGHPRSPHQDLMNYLQAIKPLISDVEASDLLPAELLWSPVLPELVNNLSNLLHGENRSGFALFIDYGGTSRHVLDPRSFGSHLRTYNNDDSIRHNPLVYAKPCHQDITWDVDFSELARLAKAEGLDTVFFGHQSALERPPMDLLNNSCQQALFKTMLHQRTSDPALAKTAALCLVARFREAPGFCMMLLAPRQFAGMKHPFGPSDPFAVEDSDSISPEMDPYVFNQALANENLPFHDLSAFLKPCGDPVADLSDLRLYRYRKTILRVLKTLGCLSPPGALSIKNSKVSMMASI